MRLNLQVKLYPTKQMRAYLDSQCDYRRYCWNKGLQTWNDLYSQRVISLPTELKLKIKESLKDKTIKFTKEETTLRMQFPSPTERIVRNELVADKNDWEYENSSRVLQLAIRDLSNTWTQFFKKSQDNTGKPKFKNRKNPKQGFKTDTARIKNNRLQLDKPRGYKGHWESIRFKGYNIPDGPIKLCAITRVKNQYIATLTVETEVTPSKRTSKVTAVDANVDHFDYTDGVYTLKPNELNRLYAKVKHYQRVLARKRNVNGKHGMHSKSYQKTRTKLQMTYLKIKQIQNDLLHKFTTVLYTNYDTIVIEDLSVKKMQMSKKAKNLHRSLFGRFRQFMEYKAKKFGKTLIIADKYYPSTQRCSSCGYIKTGDEKITLSGNKKHGTHHNEYICYRCGYEDDRDHNAVFNLLALI
jgi:putative transposase